MPFDRRKNLTKSSVYLIQTVRKLYFRLLNIFLLTCISIASFAQDGIVRFVPMFQGEKLVLDKYYHIPGGDSISFSLFKCYITGVIINDAADKRVVLKENSYHLLDIEDTSTMTIIVPQVARLGWLGFYIGVDSLMSVSGAMGGDLDPEKGMYWAWQSGYINFKIEGKCNKVPVRNHEFQYHIGGYAGKDKAIQKVGFNREASDKTAFVEIQLDKFLEGIDMSKQYGVMIPGPDAVQMAKQFANCFQLAGK